MTPAEWHRVFAAACAREQRAAVRFAEDVVSWRHSRLHAEGFDALDLFDDRTEMSRADYLETAMQVHDIVLGRAELLAAA